MSVEGVNATALRSLRCDSALMSALQRLNERAIDSDSARRRGTSGTDILVFPRSEVAEASATALLGTVLGQPLRRPGGLSRRLAAQRQAYWWTTLPWNRTSPSRQASSPGQPDAF